MRHTVNSRTSRPAVLVLAAALTLVAGLTGRADGPARWPAHRHASSPPSLAPRPLGERPSARSVDAPGAARPCPPTGRLIGAGVPLQAALDAATDGMVLCLSPGVYHGPIVIRHAVQLQGPADAVIQSDGHGTTVRVVAPHAELHGFSVNGSGQRYDKMDAAVYVRGADVAVRALTVRHALFGLVAELSTGVVFEGNHIVGDATTPVGIRGDGIRLWEVRGATVSGNLLEDSRDMVVWYSPGNRISDNTVVRSRYATHFMYSSDCVVSDNHFTGNIVGVFIMYSDDVALTDNLITDNTAADGMGLGVKESGNIIVKRNRFIHDNECVYFDNSPFRRGDTMIVEGNTFARCSAGVTFHNSETDSTFADNRFDANQTQVAIEGRGTALGVDWHGNYFDDYQGYDLNGDGYGDVPYESRDLSERLVSQHPGLAFFRGTVALAMVNVAARAFPMLQPHVLFIDRRPRMTPPADR